MKRTLIVLVVVVAVAGVVFANKEAELNIGTPVTRVVINTGDEPLAAERAQELLATLEDVEKVSVTTSATGLEALVWLKPKKAVRKSDVNNLLKEHEASVETVEDREVDPRGNLKPRLLEAKVMEKLTREKFFVVGRVWLQQVTEEVTGREKQTWLERCAVTAVSDETITYTSTRLDEEWNEGQKKDVVMSLESSDRVRGKLTKERVELRFGKVNSEKLDQVNKGLPVTSNGKKRTVHSSWLTWRLAENRFQLKSIGTQRTVTPGEEDSVRVTTKVVLEVYE